MIMSKIDSVAATAADSSIESEEEIEQEEEEENESEEDSGFDTVEGLPKFNIGRVAEAKGFERVINTIATAKELGLSEEEYQEVDSERVQTWHKDRTKHVELEEHEVEE